MQQLQCQDRSFNHWYAKLLQKERKYTNIFGTMPGHLNTRYNALLTLSSDERILNFLGIGKYCLTLIQRSVIIEQYFAEGSCVRSWSACDITQYLVGRSWKIPFGLYEMFSNKLSIKPPYFCCPLQWRDGVSNYQPHDCLLDRLFRRRSKKTSKLRVTGLCAGNSPVIGEFPRAVMTIKWSVNSSAPKNGR